MFNFLIFSSVLLREMELSEVYKFSKMDNVTCAEILICVV